MPSLSRPCYATIATGVWPEAHGVLQNEHAGRATVPGVFDRAAGAGLRTAAAAYHWWWELHTGAPYDPSAGPARDHPAGPIAFGRYYHEDSFPAEALFGLAGEVVLRHRPDLMLIHPMDADYAGHRYGGLSAQYRAAVRRLGELLREWIPRLLTHPGATVIVTSDHGMGADGTHGGADPELTQLPLWAMGGRVTPGEGGAYPQTALAPTLCRLLGLEPPATMKEPPMDWIRDHRTTEGRWNSWA